MRLTYPLMSLALAIGFMSSGATGNAPSVPKSGIPGTYYFGDGLGVNCSLSLTSKGRFRFGWSGCLGEYDRNEGTWSLDGDIVVLKPKKPNQREGFQGMGVRFVPVTWGKRWYLVEESDMPGFAASARKKGTENKDLELMGSGSDYVKRDANFKLPAKSGVPLLPHRYMHFYQHGPITAAVKRVNSNGTVDLRGSFGGRLQPGMLMAVEAFENIDLKVLTVTGDFATAQPRYVWNSAVKIKVGDKFTTGDGYTQPHGAGYRVFPTLGSIPKEKASSRK